MIFLGEQKLFICLTFHVLRAWKAFVLCSLSAFSHLPPNFMCISYSILHTSFGLWPILKWNCLTPERIEWEQERRCGEGRDLWLYSYHVWPWRTFHQICNFITVFLGHINFLSGECYGSGLSPLRTQMLCIEIWYLLLLLPPNPSFTSVHLCSTGNLEVK